MDYIEANKLISRDQEGFRPGRSCSRTITHSGLCIENAHTHNKDILIAYLDFTQAFLSANHLQLERPPLPRHLCILHLYSCQLIQRSTHYLRNPLRQNQKNTRSTTYSPRGPPIPSPLPSNDRAPRPMSNSLHKCYTFTSNKLNLSSKWYADDAILVAHNVTDINTQVEVVNTLNEWSDIRINIPKCRLTSYTKNLQSLKRKKDRDSALQARLANIRVGHTPISITFQDGSLPGGYLGTTFTASLCPKAHLKWKIDTLSTISKAIISTPVPPRIKICLLLYEANSKIIHTHCIMIISPAAITTIDSKLEAISRKIWKIPKGFPREGMHAPHDELGLNRLSIWEDYCCATINSWAHILNDQGALGATSRASLN